jgi:hypothetical protein
MYYVRIVLLTTLNNRGFETLRLDCKYNHIIAVADTGIFSGFNTHIIKCDCYGFGIRFVELLRWGNNSSLKRTDEKARV